MNRANSSLKPRKAPVQARSAETLKALHIATIQVLTQEGLARCTTTSVADRAGLSVGSLYQYYPNRDALLAAVLEAHLEDVAKAVSRACSDHAGKPLSEMVSGVVPAFLKAKLSNPDEARALYAVAGERGGAEIVKGINARICSQIAAMLLSAPDAIFQDAALTASIGFNAMVGPVKALLDGHIPAHVEPRLNDELIELLFRYFRTADESNAPY